MRKILFILAFIPLLIFGQGTQNLTVKRVKTDSLYIQKLASVSSSNIVLVLDSLTGKIGKRPYPAGGGDSYWQELTGNLANIDTTTGFYVNSTSGVKNTNLSMYPASSWWRIEQSNRTTGVQSVAQGSAGVVSLQANAGGATDVVQVNGAGYLYGRTGSNGMNLGSSTYRWGLLYSDSVNTKTIYANGRAYGVGVYGQSEYSNGIKGLSDKSSGVLGLTATGTAVQGTATGAGKAGSFTATGGGEGIYISAPTGAYAAAIYGNVGIGKTNPSTALDVTGVITATGGTSTDWNTAYGWGNHSGLYIPLPESGITAGDIWYGGDTKTETISKPAGEDNYTLKWMGGTGGAPSWQTENWTQSGSYIIRHNRVGIGVDNPLYWLHVGGAVKSDTNITPLVLGGSAVSSSLTLQSTSATGSSDYIALKTGSGSDRVRVTTDGKVGIGTTNPGASYLLDVNGAASATVFYFANTARAISASTYQGFSNGAVSLKNTSTDASSALSFFAKNVEVGRFVSSGNLGIGTTAPTAKLHVAGAARITDTVYNPIHVGGTDVSSSLTLQSTSATGSSDYIALKTGSGSDRVRVTSGGNVGIGTTNPGTILEVTGTTTMDEINGGSYRPKYVSGDLDIRLRSDARSMLFRNNTGTTLMTMKGTGNLGIGTTAPTAKVDISGNMKLGGTDTTGVGSTANVGAIHYYNGHFYGLIPGSPPQWKQLDN